MGTVRARGGRVREGTGWGQPGDSEGGGCEGLGTLGTAWGQQGRAGDSRDSGDGGVRGAGDILGGIKNHLGDIMDGSPRAWGHQCWLSLLWGHLGGTLGTLQSRFSPRDEFPENISAAAEGLKSINLIPALGET